MRQAMAAAPVGDDVYGEDPTVNALEQQTATRLGKEAGLFVASGTMGNLTAILTHATRGDAAIVGRDAHTFAHEAGGMSALGSILPHPLPTNNEGRMALDDIEGAIADDDPHNPRTRLILVENSYGAKNGYPLPPDYFAAVRAIANRYNLLVHLDGARLFNAAAALNLAPAELTQHVDSVSVCLSKGLCAPVGSVLVGSAGFIHQARRTRKVLGGGMRQAGVLAAAGLIALNEMSLRLAEDHANAQRLAQGLARLPGIEIDPAAIKTNIVFFSLSQDVAITATEVAQQLRERANVWLGAWDPRYFRAVTHYWVGPQEVDILLSTLQSVLGDIQAG
jgi:threonine aldolase